MSWRPGSGQGAGGEPGRPAGPVPAAAGPGAEWDAFPPSSALAVAVEAASGPEWRCPGAADDELTGILRRWAALESWAAAGRLGVIREMIRRESPALLSGGRHGDLPDAWGDSLGHELALALGVSVQSAETTALLAWDLQARLPGIGARLADGTLSYLKVMLVAKELAVLGEGDAAKAEALALDQIAEAPGLTPGQLARAAAQAVVTVDPDGARRRREAAEKLDVRVRLWREQSGAAALAGRNLPTDEALAAYASVNARTAQYKNSKAFPGASMDQLRALAYLDLLNGVTAADRVSGAGAGAASRQGGSPAAAQSDPAVDAGDPSRCPCRECDGGCVPPAGPADDDEHHADGPDGERADDSGPVPGEHPGPQRSTDLVIPLLTLLGLAERPGEGHGLGPIDPALCRDLADAAASSPRSEWCLTVTDADGFAIGHGCARWGAGDKATWEPRPRQAGTKPARLAALPSRVNLTVPASRLPFLAARALPWASDWRFTPRDGATMPGNRHGVPGDGRSPRRSGDPPATSGSGPSGTPAPATVPPAAFGTWKLILPGSRQLTVRIEPVPTHECDHRHESHGYQPGDRLRHLVQVRDGNCTFPACSRHARETDFEHAVPYHQGGRTCACNAGARSRRCHRVKQSPGWDVTQPRPGWHRWTTPGGRVYTQPPKRYPA